MKAEPENRGQSLNLHPLNDCVLVELQQSTKNFNVKEGKYDSRTEGVVIEIDAGRIKARYAGKPVQFENDGLAKLLGKRIHFDAYVASEPIKRNGKQYGFIKIADIRGYED